MGDGSAATSLEALFRLEEERQNDIRRAVVRRREAEEAERRDAELRIEESARARDRAEAARRDAELRAEESARARDRAEEAERARAFAEVERARVAAEEAELARAHAVTMALLRRDADTQQLKRLLAVVTLAAVTMVGGGAALYLLQLEPVAAQKHAQAVADVAARDEALRDLGKRLEASDRAAETRSTELDTARRDAAKLRLEIAQLRATRDPKRGRAPSPVHAVPAASPPCNPRDPMCFDLPK